MTINDDSSISPDNKKLRMKSSTTFSARRRREEPHALRLVVFDLDNTLVDTLDAIVQAFNQSAGVEMGRQHSKSDVVAYFGPTEENLMRRLFPGPRSESVIQRFYEAYEEGLRGLVPYAGVCAILDRLANAGIALGLCTGKGRVTTTMTLRHLGLDACFRFVMTGDDVHSNKPDPEPLLRIASQAGCRPAQMAMVGDMLADVRAARSAGAKALLVLWGHPDSRAGQDADARREAHALFDSPESLDAWFRREGVYGDASEASV